MTKQVTSVEQYFICTALSAISADMLNIEALNDRENICLPPSNGMMQDEGLGRPSQYAHLCRYVMYVRSVRLKGVT